MKSNEIIISSLQLDPAIADLVEKKDSELKTLAVKNAKHFARRNLPAALGDRLANYTGELKTGYEKLSAEIFQKLQPAAHFPEAKIDHDFYKEKDNELGEKINSLQHLNHQDEYELGDFSPASIYQRIRIAAVSTFIIMLGEILFNTKSFQITGENLLFALILSISVSFAVFVFAHIVPMLYKAARTKLQRRIVIGGSALLVTALFTALAVFRSEYLASHEVYISPGYFVLINLFFFTVSALLSFFVLPNWKELKENASRIKTYRAMLKRTALINELKKEREANKATLAEKTKQRIRLVHTANYSAETFRRMYHESAEVFKRTNLAYRTDGKSPDCFSQKSEEPDIQDVSFNLNVPNRKAS